MHAFFASRRSIFKGELEAFQSQRDYCRTPPRVWDFLNGDLLLLQDGIGDYWWADQADLWKKDKDVTLRRTNFYKEEIQEIVGDRVLCVMDTDARLSDFDLLSDMSRSPRQLTFDSWRTDFVTTRLAGSQDIVILTRLANGEKEVNEAATADYERAKSDIRRDKKDTLNMRRFCDRYGPVGIGPSDLTKRVTHGKITDRELRSPSTTDDDTNSASSTNLPSTDPWQIIDDDPSPYGVFCDPPSPQCRNIPMVYSLFKLFQASSARLEAIKFRSERKKARLEKRTVGYEAPVPGKNYQILDAETAVSHISQEDRGPEAGYSLNACPHPG